MTSFYQLKYQIFNICGLNVSLNFFLCSTLSIHVGSYLISGIHHKLLSCRDGRAHRESTVRLMHFIDRCGWYVCPLREGGGPGDRSQNTLTLLRHPHHRLKLEASGCSFCHRTVHYKRGRHLALPPSPASPSHGDHPSAPVYRNRAAVGQWGGQSCHTRPIPIPPTATTTAAAAATDGDGSEAATATESQHHTGGGGEQRDN